MIPSTYFYLENLFLLELKLTYGQEANGFLSLQRELEPPGV